MSMKYYIHASPTLFNAGLQYNQLSSCYLLQINDDSIFGIYKTLQDCALVSKYGGGISVSISGIRCKDSVIKSTNGKA